MLDTLVRDRQASLRSEAERAALVRHAGIPNLAARALALLRTMLTAGTRCVAWLRRAAMKGGSGDDAIVDITDLAADGENAPGCDARQDCGQPVRVGS